ncbi:hypothetical protein PP707_05470 [Acetobacter pasteurianus]|nr:hypothetical protein [Acetobacter pasteurianus]
MFLFLFWLTRRLAPKGYKKRKDRKGGEDKVIIINLRVLFLKKTTKQTSKDQEETNQIEVKKKKTKATMVDFCLEMN